MIRETRLIQLSDGSDSSLIASTRELREAKARQLSLLAENKTWPVLSISGIGSDSVTMRTKWQDGAMLFTMDIRGFPRSWISSFPNRPFKLLLYDLDEFEILGHQLSKDEFKFQVDESNKRTWIRVDGQVQCESETYSKARSWAISYSQ